MNNRLRSTALAALVACGFASGVALAEDSMTRSARVDDATMLAKIKTSLLRATDVDGLDVNVDVRNGVVTLSGSAASQDERAKAERIAGSADGVRSVNNRIVLKPDSGKQDGKLDATQAVPGFTAPPLAAPIPALGQTGPGQHVQGETPAPPPAN
jgi:hypothetical protein